eukprot:CCRYP_013397-RA/>CCRYP_013397-RA protein AED:0.12 eAED:0.13 QI:0/0/0/1/0/0/2/0/328
MALLALQFGIQPSVTKRYTSPEIIKSTVIFLQEVVKLVLAVLGISLSSDGWSKATAGWSVSSWLRLSPSCHDLPCSEYVLPPCVSKSRCDYLQRAQSNQDSFCCDVLLSPPGKTAKWHANAGVGVAVDGGVGDGGTFAARCIVAVFSFATEIHSWSDTHFSSIIFVWFCWGNHTKESSGRKSKCSSLHDGIMRGIHPSLTDFISKSDDGAQIRQRGFFDQWTLFTILPILTNAAGGILVGLVIKYAGTVQKGFALIFGILISGLLQGSLSKEEMAGGVMAGISLWMHSTYPYLANIGENAPLENGVTIAKATKAANAGRRGRKSRKED